MTNTIFGTTPAPRTLSPEEQNIARLQSRVTQLEENIRIARGLVERDELTDQLDMARAELSSIMRRRERMAYGELSQAQADEITPAIEATVNALCMLGDAVDATTGRDTSRPEWSTAFNLVMRLHSALDVWAGTQRRASDALLKDERRRTDFENEALSQSRIMPRIQQNVATAIVGAFEFEGWSDFGTEHLPRSGDEWRTFRDVVQEKRREATAGNIDAGGYYEQRSVFSTAYPDTDAGQRGVALGYDYTALDAGRTIEGHDEDTSELVAAFIRDHGVTRV